MYIKKIALSIVITHVITYGLLYATTAHDPQACLLDDNSDRSSSCSEIPANCGLGYIHVRSQGSNTARQLVGWQRYIHIPEREGIYGAATLAYEYTRSFRSERISRALFGINQLRFAGSSITNRLPNEIVADLFGLPSTFRGKVCFDPVIENHIVELSAYVGLDAYICSGAYMRFNAPLVHTRWDLGLRTRSNISDMPDLPSCSFTAHPLPAAASLADALSGNFAVNGQELLCASRFPLSRQVKTELASLDVILGYDFLRNDHRHAGLYAIALLPTGNTPTADIFHPIVGNYGHFELGAGISAHTVLWSDACGDESLSMYIEGYGTHLFKRKQCRVLDFCRNGQLSRYLLLREFKSDHVTPTGNLISGTCFNNRSVDVSILFKADVTFKLEYYYCGLSIDLGYNIYGHTQEDVCLRHKDHHSRKPLGIAGNSGTCCTTYPIALSELDTQANCTIITGSALGTTDRNATFSKATIFKPTQEITPDFPAPMTNAPTAQTVCLIAGTPTPEIGTIVPFADAAGCTPTDPVLDTLAIARESIRPLLITNSSSTMLLDTLSAQSCSVFTHKLFTHISYTWLDQCGLDPHIGIGAEVEFDGNSCDRASLNQWGIWLKGGISF